MLRGRPLTLLRRVAGLGCMLGLGACADVSVVPATEDSEGLRFYRPQPYLSVTYDPADDAVSTEGTSPTPDAGTDAVPGMRVLDDSSGHCAASERAAPGYRVRLTIVYLPNLDEEYALDTTGIGAASYEANLGDGWNLTSLSVSSASSAEPALTAATTVLSLLGTHPASNADTPTVAEASTVIPPGIYAMSFGAAESGASSSTWTVRWDRPVITLPCPEGLACEIPEAVTN